MPPLSQAPLVRNRSRRGGPRPGSGPKPKGAKAGVSHRTRAATAASYPAHVTVKLQRLLPLLRRPREYATLRKCFAKGCDRMGFRLIHYAVLNEHMHFLVEARDRTALTRGVQGLLIRIAKALNKLWCRKGKVFFDRYHDRILKSTRDVRNVLRYVLQNGKKHAAQGRKVKVPGPIDMYTSAPWFDGFVEVIRVAGLEALVRPVTDARTWMLTEGWRRHGLIGVHELPRTG